MTGHATGPPGNDAGAGANRPRNAERLAGGSDASTIPPEMTSERVYVVGVTCGVLHWRRVFLSAGSAQAYEARMWRLGNPAEITTATLVGGAP